MIPPQFDSMSLKVPLVYVQRQLFSSAWLHCDLVNDWTILLNNAFFDYRGIDRTFIATTYFYSKFFNPDIYSFEKVKKWTIKWRLEDVNLNNFIIPIHIGEAHWFLMVVKKNRK